MIEPSRGRPGPPIGAPTLTALVPVKHLSEAKGRLRDQLDPGERIALVVGLLRSVLGTLLAGGIQRRLVVSPDPLVLAVARAAGAQGLRQHDRGLNQALEAARHQLPTSALLIVPADLPLLRASDLAAVRRLLTPATAVIAPDREGSGTNLLALPAGSRPPFAFGPGSCARHQAGARAAGLSVALYQATGTALDLDTPADLAELQRHGWPTFGGLLGGEPLGAATGGAW